MLIHDQPSMPRTDPIVRKTTAVIAVRHAACLAFTLLLLNPSSSSSSTGNPSPDHVRARTFFTKVQTVQLARLSVLNERFVSPDGRLFLLVDRLQASFSPRSRVSWLPESCRPEAAAVAVAGRDRDCWCARSRRRESIARIAEILGSN